MDRPISYTGAVAAVRRHEGRAVLVLLAAAVLGVLMVAAGFPGPVTAAGIVVTILAVVALTLLLIEAVTSDA